MGYADVHCSLSRNYIVAMWCVLIMRSTKICFIICRVSHLLMLLHRGVELLGQIVGYIRHPRLFLVGSADAALVFVGFLVVLLFGILAVSLGSLEIDGHGRLERQRLHNKQDEVMQLS